MKGKLAVAALAAVLMCSLPAAASSAPQAQQHAELGPAATFILKGLAEGALQRVGGDATGWVMKAFGLDGDATSAQLAAISEQLQRIETQIVGLQQRIAAVEQEVKQGNCDQYSTEASNIAADAATASVSLRILAGTPKDETTTVGGKKVLLRKVREGNLKTFIEGHLTGKSGRFTKIMVGNGAGQGLISACGKAILNRSAPFVTFFTSRAVHDLVAYYQDVEVEVLNVEVEYAHATGDNGETIKNLVTTVQNGQAVERSRLRTEVPESYFVDPRSGLAWTSKAYVQTYQKFNDDRNFGPISLYGLNGLTYPTRAQWEALFKDAIGDRTIWLLSQSGLLVKGLLPCVWIKESVITPVGPIAMGLDGGGPAPYGTSCLDVRVAPAPGQYTY